VEGTKEVLALGGEGGFSGGLGDLAHDGVGEASTGSGSE
jgi:hypothetical protein